VTSNVDICCVFAFLPHNLRIYLFSLFVFFFVSVEEEWQLEFFCRYCYYYELTQLLVIILFNSRGQLLSNFNICVLNETRYGFI
jgi:hypothetical protein